MSLNLRRNHKAKRLVSMTLACLMVLYSLPPAVDGPKVFQSAENPHADEWMMLRNRAGDLGLGELAGELQHHAWHMQSGLMSALNGIYTACTTPIAEAFIHFKHVVPAIINDGSGRTDYYLYSPLPTSATVFRQPVGTRAGYPTQNSPHTLTLNRGYQGQNANESERVEYYNSFFSENPQSKGYRVYLAHHVDKSDVNYPRALIQGDTDYTLEYRSIFINAAEGWVPVWRDWYSGHRSAEGNVPNSLQYGHNGPIDFACKENPG